MKLFVAVMASLVLLLGASMSFAEHKKDPPPPPKEEVDCSPGYWKNHTEVWFDDVCCSGEMCDLLLDNLSARGRGGAALRAAAQGVLNECFFDDGSPCDDD